LLAQPRQTVATSRQNPARLFASNGPASFWKLMMDPGPTDAEWWSAALTASDVLPPAARDGVRDLDELLERTLGEAQFGPEHFRLSGSKRAYYALKGILPRPLTRTLRRAHRHRSVRNFGLDWPVESRYVDFVRATLAQLLRARALDSVPFVHFWPERRRWALVLTHDVETAAGQTLIPGLADLEERLGFRSSFNLIPERYELDHGLISDLRRRGFEVGVHDLNHDGKLFNSHSQFLRRVQRINRHIREIDADGFRAALMHRNPDWMQALEVDYDLSFFDTDPYEPVPGGTMSIWPFQLGHLVELPYTLVQDYTLTAVLRERTPRLWTEKAAFVAEHCGMVLLNAHPDYLRQNEMERVYTEFLETIRGKGDYWHALPRDVARWWRARADAATPASLPGATIARARLAPSEPGGVELSLAGDDSIGAK
jgi:hypothetical protein